MPEINPEEYTKRLMHLANEKAKTRRCQRCGDEKPKNAVDLYEFGDPYIPSTVYLYCTECKFGEVFAQRSLEDSMRWANYVKGEGKDETKAQQTEKMVQEAIVNAKKAPNHEQKEDPNVTKDEDNTIIADKETVAKKDKKRKK